MEGRLSSSRLRRYIVAAFLPLFVAAAGLTVIPSSASAATSAPLALGVGSTTDDRVAEISSTTTGARVRMSSYKVGVSGTSVDAQRWTLELVASAATSLTYRIRNQSSGLCLKKNGSNQVVIADCNTASDLNSLRWRVVTTEDPFGGWRLRNVSNSQCMQIVSGSGLDGALLQTAACANVSHQRWRIRKAPIDCTVRSREATMTDICATLTQPASAVIANWSDSQVGLAWVDPEAYILSHSVFRYLQVESLNQAGAPSGASIEFGSSGQRGPLPSDGVTYGAYWLEWGQGREFFHAIDPVQAPGSESPDGAVHTYLVERNPSGQWDLFYDFNYVGTSALQGGGYARFIRNGMSVRYLQHAAVNTSMQTRLQVSNASVWRRPSLGELGTGEPKACEAPPRYEDWSYDTVNLSPNCYTSSYATRSGANGSNSPQLDSFTVAKPGTVTTAAAGSRSVPSPGSRESASAEMNGVDQSKLAACLQTAPESCLREVPGLAACVAARQTCKGGDLHRIAPAPSRPLTISAAKDAVRRLTGQSPLRGGQRAVATRVNLLTDPGVARAVRSAGVALDDEIYIVTSGSTVPSLSPTSQKTYAGSTFVVRAATGRLVYACLGVGCPVALNG
ncbi:RICIN domain-containing protein [Micromonospora aurantiaca]|uniref:RICIN domain-containing protein n=1 Tax=Micromonospora aurantiaca (nom. illeg.) TaxID=47850 RepID=A0ABQ6UAH3_9ACTN|nr:RICIN domain-containing protein [Micromonospora aurantiaca]KAB1107443.1 RICIN domain-containing protein [Micromonospora aurantiaca]